MKLHILLHTHQLSAGETADLSIFLLTFLCVDVLLHSKLHRALLVAHTNSQVHTRSGLMADPFHDRQVAEELQSGAMSTEEKELLHLLTSPHLKVDNFHL